MVLSDYIIVSYYITIRLNITLIMHALHVVIYGHISYDGNFYIYKIFPFIWDKYIIILVFSGDFQLLQLFELMIQNVSQSRSLALILPVYIHIWNHIITRSQYEIE